MRTGGEILLALDACGDARQWADDLRGIPARKAWEACKRGDWLLWLAAKLNVDRKLVVLAACDCARTALQFVPAGEERPRIAIETAEAWTRGEATIEQVRAAAAAAYADDDASAANVAYAAAAAYAASDARDTSLATFAEDVVQILVDMKAPGCQWLELTEAA